MPDGAIEGLASFVERLLEQNKVMNLTGITEPFEVVDRHILDSATVLPFLPDRSCTLVDVGTGGGFPGVPLKFLRPDLDVTLLDGLAKRLDWLEETTADLGLHGITTLHGRGEEVAHDHEYRESFDVATARGVAELRILAEICLPLVKVGGVFLAQKGRDCAHEIEGASDIIEKVGGAQAELVPISGGETAIVVIRKISKTPDNYPRRWASITRAPKKKS
ncbi:MAG: 16S rRNA (guanine(527)-N(7))-methyltransferase RsmG [Eubacteriales bacterium]